MEEINYIGADELVFNKDNNEGIYSGGFSVKSIMMKAGVSPIMTVNTTKQLGGGSNLSDLFESLVIPNWTLSYGNRMTGGQYIYESEEEDFSDEENEEIEDDLHDKLLNLVREQELKGGLKETVTNSDTVPKVNKRKITRKHKLRVKKGGTKRNKIRLD
jgi:hypothetical protein